MFKSLVNLKIRFKIVNNPSLFDVNIERRVRFLLLLLPGMIKNMWGVRRVRFTLYNSLTCNINTQVRARWNSLSSIIISVHIFYVCPSSKRDILNYPEFSFVLKNFIPLYTFVFGSKNKPQWLLSTPLHILTYLVSRRVINILYWYLSQ